MSRASSFSCKACLPGLLFFAFACSSSSNSIDAGVDDANPLLLIDASVDAHVFKHCSEVDAFGQMFAQQVARWNIQDNSSAPPAGSVVFVGSSSIRRWEGLAQDFRDFPPIQRGFGGAQLAEVAYSAHELVLRHNPRAIVVFAGTNDVAAGVASATVVERFQCFRERVGAQLGWQLPIVFIGITPTPSRWQQWSEANAVNAAVEQLAQEDPGLYYADLPTAFLATGSPPRESLFVEDMLHLSPEGYALWNGALRPVLEAATTPTVYQAPATMPAGTRMLIDLGPSNEGQGEVTPSPDHLGQHWNNWHPLAGGSSVVAGEHVGPLVTSTGDTSKVQLVVTGGFAALGFSDGGLRWPAADKLDTLAVGSATGDYFYSEQDDKTGGLALTHLAPNQRYTLRLLAAREHSDTRRTRYQVGGANLASQTVQSSGSMAGSDNAQVNDDDLVEFTGLVPDAWGNLYIDLQPAQGPYAYLSLIELVVQ